MRTLITPLTILTLAGDRYEKGEPVEGTAAVIGDACGRKIATLAVAGTAEFDNARAAAIVAACNRVPDDAADTCDAMLSLCEVRATGDNGEFWRRLSGSVRKARTMV